MAVVPNQFPAPSVTRAPCGLVPSLTEKECRMVSCQSPLAGFCHNGLLRWRATPDECVRATRAYVIS